MLPILASRPCERPPFADETFDAAVVARVYVYVQDMPAALGELLRVLRSGDRLHVFDTDWGPIVWHSRNPERMQRGLSAWDGTSLTRISPGG